jgi:fumarate reductase subunit D
MELLSKLFDALTKTVGSAAVFLVVTAFIVLQFGDTAVKVFNQKPEVALAAVGLFVVGVFLGLVHVLSVHFGVPAGRGFLEGLAAGVVAGVLAGWLYKHCPAQPRLVEAAVSWAFFLTVAVCGIYGLTLSLCEPRTKLRWSQRIAAIIVLIAAIMLPVGLAVGYYAERMVKDSRYVTFMELGMIAGAFILAKAAFPLWRTCRRWSSFLGRLAGLGVLALLISGLATEVSRRFSDGPLGSDLTCSGECYHAFLKFADPQKTPVAVLAILGLIVGASLCYFAVTTNLLPHLWRRMGK